MKIGMKDLLIALTCLAASFSVFAATQKQSTKAAQPGSQTSSQAAILPRFCDNHVELLLAGGIAGIHTRDSHMQVTSSEIDTLDQTNSYRWDKGEGELGVGYVYYMVDGPRLSDDLRWFPTFEPMLNLYYSNLDIHGDVYRFNNVLLNDLRYKTTVQNTRLMLDAVLTIASQGRCSVHALLGLGEGWSRVGYHDNTDNTSEVSLNTNNNGNATRVSLNTDNQTNLVWEWGVGLNYAFTRQASLSLEYVFTDLGRMHTSSTGVANNITSPQLVGANFQVTTQAILLGLHMGLS